jgi:lysozyme family protein
MKAQEIITEILRREGGYVNHPDDRGGPTNLGITQATLSDWLGRPATIEDVKALDEETAREIYVTRYMSGPRIDTLPPAIVPFTVDASVNHGPRNAIKMVQRVVNEAGFGPIGVDGVIGPKSRAAAQAAQEAMGEWFLAALVEERRNVYRRIVARNPSQEVFLKGWMNRVAEFEPAIKGRATA